MENKTLLRGAPLKKKILTQLEKKVADLPGHLPRPGLAILRVGEDPASKIYIGMKIRAAERIGFRGQEHHLPLPTSMAELEEAIAKLNADSSVHGLICQFPLPKGLDELRVAGLIDPLKDIDCFHPGNVGLVSLGQPRFLPCTPAGILRLLQEHRVPLAGRNVVVLGRSNIVGKPLGLMLMAKGVDATVTVCHSQTQNLASLTRQADVLIAAVGRPGFVGPEMVAEGALVIDVGIHYREGPEGREICGDVDFAAVAPKARAITPVPGGVGPMTVAMLMENTFHAFALQEGLPSAPWSWENPPA